MYLIGYTNSVVEVYEYLSSRIGWKYNPSPLFNLVYPVLSLTLLASITLICSLLCFAEEI